MLSKARADAWAHYKGKLARYMFQQYDIDSSQDIQALSFKTNLKQVCSADYSGRTCDICPGKQVKCPAISNITLTECPRVVFPFYNIRRIAERVRQILVVIIASTLE